MQESSFRRYKGIEVLSVSDTHLSVKTPYRSSFVIELKRCLMYRQWNNDKMVWYVKKDEENTLARLLKKYYGYTHVVTSVKEVPLVKPIPKTLPIRKVISEENKASLVSLQNIQTALDLY